MMAMALLVCLVTASPGRVVVMPLEVHGAKEEAAALVQVERSLEESLRRLLPDTVVAYRDLMATAGVAMRQQMAGCDDSSCLTQLAEDLQADGVVAVRVQKVGRNYLLDAVLMDKRTGQTRRGTTQAQGVTTLLDGVEDVARALARNARYSLEDPLLADRLGTNAAGITALRTRTLAHPEDSVTANWTAVLLEHNRPRPWLALAQGGALVAAAGALLAAVLIITPALGASFAAGLYTGMIGPAFYANSTAPSQDTATDDAALQRSYPLPLVIMVAPVAAGLVLALVLVTSGVFAVAWSVPALLARSKRIAVRPAACCRDDELLAQAEQPTLQEKLGGRLGIVGALLLMMAPVVTPFASILGMGCCLVLLRQMGPPGSFSLGPAVNTWAPLHFVLGTVVALGSLGAVLLTGLGLGGMATLVTAALVATEGTPVVDG